MGAVIEQKTNGNNQKFLDTQVQEIKDGNEQIKKITLTPQEIEQQITRERLQTLLINSFWINNY